MLVLHLLLSFLQNIGVTAASAGFAHAQAAVTHTAITLCHLTAPRLVKRMAMRLLETDNVNIPFNKFAHNSTIEATLVAWSPVTKC